MPFPDFAFREFYEDRLVWRLYASVRAAPANSQTDGAPTATSEAIFPLASTSTAESVPEAPKACPAENCWSSTTVEARPISLLASSVPAETNKSLGASSGRFASHFFISGRICWQKPHPGFQKRACLAGDAQFLRETVSYF